MASIRLEEQGDAGAVEALVAAAFGPGRFAKSAYRLREGVYPVAGLSCVAELNGRVVGTVRYWPVAIGTTPGLMLGPIAVERALQGQGIALSLMQASLEAARALGHRVVILVGDEPYYARAGFSRVMPAGSVTMPGPVDPARLLWLALAEGALENVAGDVRKIQLDEKVTALGAALSPLASPA